MDVTAFIPCTITQGGSSEVNSVNNSKYWVLTSAKFGAEVLGGGARYINVNAVASDLSRIIWFALEIHVQIINCRVCWWKKTVRTYLCI